MRRLLVVGLVVLVAFAAGAAWMALRRPTPAVADGPAVIQQVREVARLETLQVTLFRKINFQPDPSPTGSTFEDVAQWARFALHRPSGRAIVFADVSLGLNLDQLDPSHLQVRGDSVRLVLPSLTAKVSLRPADTEVIDSNLDSQETAALLEHARVGFEREVERDEGLKHRARASAERALRAQLYTLGFRHVELVDGPVRPGQL